MLSREQFKRLLENSRLKKPFLVGKRGEGKTQYLKDYCTEEMLSLWILNLSCLDAADFSGMPYIKDGITHYARPVFFNCDVLFLDEMDRIQDQQVKSTLLSFLIDHKINGHEFTGKIVGAGNGTKEGTNETSDFDDAMSDRLIFIPFEYTIEEKLAYLSKKFDADNMFLKYIKAKETIFDKYSTRTIEYCLQFPDDMNVLRWAMNPEIAKHYQQFVNDMVISFADLMNGKSYDKLTGMTRVSLSLDVVANIEKVYKGTDKQIKHLNGFINSLAAEEKSAYFVALKNKAISTASFGDMAKKLHERGFFNDQKDFLKILGQ